MNVIDTKRSDANASALAALVLAVWTGSAGCNAFDGCCNDCGRNYRLLEPHEPGSLRLRGGRTGGECEIGSKPYRYPRGEHWIVGEVASRTAPTIEGEGYDYDLRVESTEPPDQPPAACSDRRSFSTGTSMTGSDLAEGQPVCVRATIRVETSCTQKGCPTI
ncbi:MAG: hypothetical protein ABEL76_13615 [Bradymonadaceae bacterium]